MNSKPGVVIDAALRFAKSNPELVRYAHEQAGAAGTTADDLLREAIDRVVAARQTEPLRLLA
ncbi:MAG: hypothetical protein ABI352_05565 [Candidatus Dormibacter sp.]